MNRTRRAARIQGTGHRRSSAAHSSLFAECAPAKPALLVTAAERAVLVYEHHREVIERDFVPAMITVGGDELRLPDFSQ
jgi:hypothetical protein